MKHFENDIDFLNALGQRTPEAFDQLYASYYRPLCYFAEGLLGNPDTAQDLATESFVKLLQKPPALDSIQCLKSFLYTVTRNACYDHLRATQRHERSHLEMQYLDGQQNENAERLLIRSETLQAIYSAIEQLPDRYKGIVKLALIDEKKNEEIAADLNMAYQTVRNRKSEGFKLLRVVLSQQHNLSAFLSIYCLLETP